MARFHQRIASHRVGTLHKMATEIARTYTVVGITDLNVAGMLRNRRLALSLADAAWARSTAS